MLFYYTIYDIALHNNNIIYIIHRQKCWVVSAHIDEVFKKTHKRKSNGEFVDERSRRTVVSYICYCYFSLF